MKLRHRAAGAACVILLAGIGTALAALPQTNPIDPYGRITACLKTCKEQSPTPSPALGACERSCMPTSVPVFAPAPPNGAPNGSLYVVTVGDSIMWGQGIPEGQKFADTVTNWLQALYGPNYYITRTPQTFAHSGANLFLSSGDGPNPAPGEVPESQASVLLQLNLTLQELQNIGVPPASVILVLVDGCANDVGILAALNGFNSPDQIATATNTDCGANPQPAGSQQQPPAMQVLLQRVGTAFPNASVVVTGYYQFITPSTDPAALAGLLALGGAAAIGPWGGILGAAAGAVDVPHAQANSGAFANAVHSAYTSEVNAANSDTTLVPKGAPPRFALAWPSFTDDNGYAAPSSWLWKVGDFAGAESLALASTAPAPFSISFPFPFDPSSADAVAYYRAQWCMANNDVISTCVDASMGHPNFLGVQAYAWAVIQQIETTLHARFPPPHTVAGTPPGVVLRLLMGSDSAGPVVSYAGMPTKLTHWVWVSALNPNSGARIEHAPVSIGPLGPHQQAAGQGESFAKLYYLCKPEVIPPLRNSLAPPTPPVKACSGTVSAPGFPPALFSVPSDQL
jgi:hypothetical protein